VIKAVLFDADGVLVDACELHYVALNRALATMGWKINRTEHETIYNGLPTHKKLQLLTREKGFPEDWHSAVHSLKQQYTWDAIEECVTTDPGKRELLCALRHCGFKIAVCSNSLHRTLARMLSAVGIMDCIDLVIGNDDVQFPKPSPEMYLLAAAKLGVAMEETVIVEDSMVGLRAAWAAEPGGVVKVEGPDEVDLSLLTKIATDPILLREAA
jgi:HAD superfamily hydrolase (TIGR01509 family)